MKYSKFLIAAAGLASAAKPMCSSGQTNQDGLGNFYCDAVKALTYTNAGHPTSGQVVKSMGQSSCQMGAPDKSMFPDGPMAPLDQDVSLHFRGPLCLKQFAAYKLDESVPEKRDAHRQTLHAKRHGHGHFHQRDLPTWSKSSVPAPPPPPEGAYKRVGYYNGPEQIADGVTFMGNYGGQGSGVFDMAQLGSSLSYVNSQCTGGAASPEILADRCLESGQEFAIFSDTPCSGNCELGEEHSDCGACRPGIPALKGFEGETKVFIAELQMPLDGQRGFNGDLPAYWMLNGKIPRTQQYGGCSCWPSCGEFDIMEVLDSGDLRCKSTFHSDFPGGSSDYIPRPTDAYIKVATIIHKESRSVTVKVIPDDTEIGESLTKEQVDGWIDFDADDDMSLFSIVA